MAKAVLQSLVRLKSIIQKMGSNLLNHYLEDFFILTGLAILVGTTYYLDPIYGSYLLGAIFVVLGVLLAKRR